MKSALKRKAYFLARNGFDLPTENDSSGTNSGFSLPFPALNVKDSNFFLQLPKTEQNGLDFLSKVACEMDSVKLMQSQNCVRKRRTPVIFVDNTTPHSFKKRILRHHFDSFYSPKSTLSNPRNVAVKKFQPVQECRNHVHENETKRDAKVNDGVDLKTGSYGAIFSETENENQLQILMDDDGDDDDYNDGNGDEYVQIEPKDAPVNVSKLKLECEHKLKPKPEPEVQLGSETEPKLPTETEVNVGDDKETKNREGHEENAYSDETAVGDCIKFEDDDDDDGKDGKDDSEDKEEEEDEEEEEDDEGGEDDDDFYCNEHDKMMDFKRMNNLNRMNGNGRLKKMYEKLNDLDPSSFKILKFIGSKRVDEKTLCLSQIENKSRITKKLRILLKDRILKRSGAGGKKDPFLYFLPKHYQFLIHL